MCHQAYLFFGEFHCPSNCSDLGGVFDNDHVRILLQKWNRNFDNRG